MDNKTNWFARICLISIGALILTMVIYRFFWINPIGEISTGLLSLIAILLIIALSEVYDTFSIGALIKLSRVVKEKEKEIEKKQIEVVKVESEKRELLSQLINVTNSFSQKQSNTNFFGVTDPSKYFAIKQADETEIEERQQSENQVVENSIVPTEVPIVVEGKEASYVRKNLNKRKLEDFIIDKFIKENNVDISKIFREIKLQSELDANPISNRNAIFDAYYNNIGEEVFIEIQIDRGIISSMLENILYVLLSKLYHYKISKNNNVYLNFIIVELPSDRERSRLSISKRIGDIFEPAIRNGLLRIHNISMNEEQVKDFYD